MARAWTPTDRINYWNEAGNEAARTCDMEIREAHAKRERVQALAREEIARAKKELAQAKLAG